MRGSAIGLSYLTRLLFGSAFLFFNFLTFNFLIVNARPLTLPFCGNHLRSVAIKALSNQDGLETAAYHYKQSLPKIISSKKDDQSQAVALASHFEQTLGYPPQSLHFGENPHVFSEPTGTSPSHLSTLYHGDQIVGVLKIYNKSQNEIFLEVASNNFLSEANLSILRPVKILDAVQIGSGSEWRSALLMSFSGAPDFYHQILQAKGNEKSDLLAAIHLSGAALGELHTSFAEVLSRKPKPSSEKSLVDHIDQFARYELSALRRAERELKFSGRLKEILRKSSKSEPEAEAAAERLLHIFRRGADHYEDQLENIPWSTVNFGDAHHANFSISKDHSKLTAFDTSNLIWSLRNIDGKEKGIADPAQDVGRFLAGLEVAGLVGGWTTEERAKARISFLHSYQVSLLRSSLGLSEDYFEKAVRFYELRYYSVVLNSTQVISDGDRAKLMDVLDQRFEPLYGSKLDAAIARVTSIARGPANEHNAHRESRYADLATNEIIRFLKTHLAADTAENQSQIRYALAETFEYFAHPFAPISRISDGIEFYRGDEIIQFIAVEGLSNANQKIAEDVSDFLKKLDSDFVNRFPNWPTNRNKVLDILKAEAEKAAPKTLLKLRLNQILSHWPDLQAEVKTEPHQEQAHETLRRDLFVEAFHLIENDIQRIAPELKLNPLSTPLYFTGLPRNIWAEIDLQWILDSLDLNQAERISLRHKVERVIYAPFKGKLLAKLPFLEASVSIAKAKSPAIFSIEKSALRYANINPADYHMDITKYVSDAFPTSIQRFISSSKAEVFLHDANSSEVLKFHAAAGYFLVERIHVRKGSYAKRIFLLYNPETKLYRCAFSDLLTPDTMAQAESRLSTVSGIKSVFKTHHLAPAPLWKLTSFGNQLKLDKARILIGFKNKAAAELKQREWTAQTVSKEGIEMDLFTNPANGDQILLTRNVYGDELKLLLPFLYAKGGRAFTYLGTAGSIEPSIQLADILIPNSALGADGRWISIENKGLEKNVENLKSLNPKIPVHLKTKQGWVRLMLDETIAKLVDLRSQGAEGVDVETSYVAEFLKENKEAWGSVYLVVSDETTGGKTYDLHSHFSEQINKSVKTILKHIL